MAPSSDIAHVDWPVVGDDERLPRNPMLALDRLTQLNGSSASAGAHACGAVSLVGAILAMRGYAGLGGFVRKIADELSDETRTALEGLAKAVASDGAEATFGALADFALTIHRRYHGMDGGMDFDKLASLMRRAGFEPPRLENDEDVARTISRVGQCWPAKISIFSDSGDHWIMVGHDGRGLFVFDPYPREDGSQIIRPGEVDWRRYVAAIGQREETGNTIGFLPAG